MGRRASGGFFRRWIISLCTRLLTKPLRTYELRVPNNVEQLKKLLHKGDVVLVEGDQRVSEVIRYVTQSSWSHSTLYVGDELLKDGADAAVERLRREIETMRLELRGMIRARSKGRLPAPGPGDTAFWESPGDDEEQA